MDVFNGVNARRSVGAVGVAFVFCDVKHLCLGIEAQDLVWVRVQQSSESDYIMDLIVRSGR